MQKGKECVILCLGNLDAEESIKLIWMGINLGYLYLSRLPKPLKFELRVLKVQKEIKFTVETRPLGELK